MVQVGGVARIIAIVGPTASGKSALAIDAAHRFPSEIVSCDSVQVYRGLDIGSGKPSHEDRTMVPHHLIDILDLDQEMNAAVFAHRAAASIDDVVSRGRMPIVTGGTGLYLTALLKGLFERGGANPALRERIGALVERHGPERLHRVLAGRDPAYAAKTERTDRVRIVRALEVYFGSGRSFSEAQAQRRPAFTGEALLVGLNPDRAVLREAVTARTRQMLVMGLIAEVRAALNSVPAGLPTPRPLRAIGYREVVERLALGPLPDGGDDVLLRAIVISTMQYAKRQMTYFRHQFTVEWFAHPEAALERMTSWAKARELGEKF